MTEDQIEQFAIARLSELGYAYQHGPGIAHDGEHPERASYEQVLLLGRLREAVRRINPEACPAAAQERR
jgi:type I restriction enzyme R subunit